MVGAGLVVRRTRASQAKEENKSKRTIMVAETFTIVVNYGSKEIETRVFKVFGVKVLDDLFVNERVCA